MYRALYRKWRPQRFADVVGQTAIVTALQNQISAGRIGHAYLFTGTRGTGKTTCAKIFAKAVNCLDTSSPDPCGECEICKGIDSGSVMDIIEMDAASNNGVDDIRDLRPLSQTQAEWPPVAPGDDSIRFHVAHSAQREVEVLHDQLLAAFNADPTLRPRDVIVMVPDIDAYAPHIQAVFGLIDGRDPRFIPFSIADQGTRHHDPLVGALGKLLDERMRHIALPVSGGQLA